MKKEEVTIKVVRSGEGKERGSEVTLNGSGMDILLAFQSLINTIKENDEAYELFEKILPQYLI